jgi:chromosomal replication initiator protein
MQAVFTDEIKAVHERIAEKIGATQYQVWFKGATQLSMNDDHFEVTAANPFISNWIEGHFQPAIAESVSDVFGQPCTIRFRIDSSLVKPGEKQVVAPQKTERALNALRRTPAPTRSQTLGNPLKLTLSSFVVGAKNQLAYNAARNVISQPQSPFNPLFMHGGYGVGKTHLLQGICNEIHQNRPDCRWTYLSAEDFANQYVVALKTRKLDAFRNRFRNMDLLVIDDIHFLSNKNAMQEEFLHTFNSIDLAGKQVVLASDAHPKEISQLCDKLVNRFVSGMVVRMDAPDFEMRCRICTQRAKSMTLNLSQEVIEYVAGSISANVRELEGALIKLAAFASLSGQKISLAVARQVLAEHIARTDPVVHSSDIASTAAAFFEVSVADIHSAKKDRTISLARSFGMYLTRRFTKMSFPEIGRAFGNKNHATVILACRKIENALKGNDEMKWRTKQGFRLANAKDILDSLIETIS